MTSHVPQNRLLRKNNMQESKCLCWRYLMFFGLSKIVIAKCTPSGLIITQVKLLTIDYKAKKGANNKGIKARISVSKVIPNLINLKILEDCRNTKSKKLSRNICCHFAPWHSTTMAPFEMTHSHDQAPAAWDYSMLRVTLVYAIHIVNQSAQK